MLNTLICAFNSYCIFTLSLRAGWIFPSDYSTLVNITHDLVKVECMVLLQLHYICFFTLKIAIFLAVREHVQPTGSMYI